MVSVELSIEPDILRDAFVTSLIRARTVASMVGRTDSRKNVLAFEFAQDKVPLFCYTCVVGQFFDIQEMCAYPLPSANGSTSKPTICIYMSMP